jgi:Ca2+-binding RTX toxin-like protein
VVDAFSKLVGNVSNGTLVFNADGSFSYSPNPNFNGTDSFTYQASDGKGGFDTARVDLIVNAVNDSPTVAAAITATATEADPLFSIDLLSGASDPDASDVLNIDNLLLVSGNSEGVTVDGNRLNVNPSAYSSLTFGQSEVVRYTYNINDGNGGTISQSAAVTITGVLSTTLGTAGNDRFRGTKGDDAFSGLAGDDNIKGREGNDSLDGGDGNDDIKGGKGNDTLLGGDGYDKLDGKEGADLVDGGAGNDKLKGGKGIDTLIGSLGNDELKGEDGNDILIGGPGNDDLKGGKGADTFVLEAGAGVDFINDFEDGVDLLGLSGGLTFGQLTITQQNKDALIHLQSTNELLATLSNTSASLIGVADFISVT